MLALGFAAAPIAAPAATVTLIPGADATLIEAAPTHSSGGGDFFNAGTTQNGTRNRGLIRFDLAAAIPSNAVILSATLRLEVIRQPADGYEASLFGLHRVLRPWGEGINAPTGRGGGLGLPAQTNDATWTHRFAFTTHTWAAPGGAPGIDFVPNFSASAFIQGVAESPYDFESTAAAVADAQFWLEHPEANFGWMLLTDSENVPFTARKFASRENAGTEPQLTIEYLVPPRLENVSWITNEFRFTFTAEPGQTCVVEWATNLPAASWTAILTAAPSAQATTVLVTDPAAAPRRFYRVRAGP